MSLTCEDILEAMAQNLGFDMSPFRDQKGFSIVYKNDFVVTIEPCSEREGFYHIYSPVCDIPPEPQDREDLYTMLMRGHLFGYASHNNYFGIDRKRGKVFLFKLVNVAGMKDVDVLRQKILRFLAAEEFWREPLKAPRKYLDAAEKMNATDIDPTDPKFIEEFKSYV